MKTKVIPTITPYYGCNAMLINHGYFSIPRFAHALFIRTMMRLPHPFHTKEPTW